VKWALHATWTDRPGHLSPAARTAARMYRLMLPMNIAVHCPGVSSINDAHRGIPKCPAGVVGYPHGSSRHWERETHETLMDYRIHVDRPLGWVYRARRSCGGRIPLGHDVAPRPDMRGRRRFLLAGILRTSAGRPRSGRTFRSTCCWRFRRQRRNPSGPGCPGGPVSQPVAGQRRPNGPASGTGCRVGGRVGAGGRARNH